MQIAGYLADKPELRFLPSGSPVATARLASTHRWKDQSGETQEQTSWFALQFHDKRAEYASEALEKGDHIFVEGEFRQRKWKDDKSRERSTWELTVFHIQTLAPRVLETDAPASPAHGGVREEGGDDASWPC
jgi:single-strand DNA-binding protein